MDGTEGTAAGVAATSEQIARELTAGIRAGLYSAGQKLPTEKALSERYAVSRPVVREAISRLKSDGLAESRRGSGCYVTDPSQRRALKFDDGRIADRRGLLELFELRLPFETAAARLAAARREPADLAKMEQTLEVLRATAQSTRDFIVADQSFHNAIAAATHNRFYAEFSAFLAGNLIAAIFLIQSGSPSVDLKSSTIDEHEAILAAIRARDAERAARAVMQHFDSARLRILGL